jgi:DNA replication licensing factor MCM2
MDDDLMDGGLLSDLTKRRTRRQYDERQGIDDAAGGDMVSLYWGEMNKHSTIYQDEVLPMQELSQIKAGSIVEWLAAESVRRSVAKFFKLFLLEMTDEHGDSVYGQRIIQAGSSKCDITVVS